MNVAAEVFGEQMVRQGLCPARSSDLNTPNFYSWVTLKYQVCMENLQTFRFSEIYSVSGTHFWKMRFQRRSKSTLGNSYVK
jgi:hypothetical protein